MVIPLNILGILFTVYGVQCTLYTVQLYSVHFTGTTHWVERIADGNDEK